MAADKTLIRNGRHRCCLSGRGVQKCNLLAKRNTEDHASCHRAEARCHTRLVASNADCKKSRAAGSGILTGPSIRVRGWSRLELKTLARSVCGSAADRNCSVEQAGSDDESHHLHTMLHGSSMPTVILQRPNIEKFGVLQVLNLCMHGYVCTAHET